MAALIACGAVWRFWQPTGLDADRLRHALTTLVWYLLLPALVLDVLWTAAIGATTVRIAGIAALMIVAGLVLSGLSCKVCRQGRDSTGALMLAAGFGNVTYLGLPVLEQTLGPWARSVAIQYDLFASTPLLLTLGAVVGKRYGDGRVQQAILPELLRVPPLWAAVIAAALNLLEIPRPTLLHSTMELLGGSVVPLMLIALGLSLRWHRTLWRQLPTVAPVVLIKLLIVPLLALGATSVLGMHGDLRIAVVLEAAMPSMVIGIVLCDRYGLNTHVYAAAVTITTVISIASLPFWFTLLNGGLANGF
jgi:predicted permease